MSSILVENIGAVRVLRLNRASKRNALSVQMFEQLTRELHEAAADESVALLAITGVGDYFSSGNDLANFALLSTLQPAEAVAKARAMVEDLVAALIDFPKPLAALVNGPAVGIAVTMLGLCDIVYCSEAATFHTPFAELGQCSEGCSSWLFPRLMGPAMAMDVLLLGRKLDAREALAARLVSRLLPAATFAADADALLRRWADAPLRAMRHTKLLARRSLAPLLHQVNRDECSCLAQLWLSDECANAVLAFMQRKAAKL